jgi:hypothetical protein
MLQRDYVTFWNEENEGEAPDKRVSSITGNIFKNFIWQHSTLPSSGLLRGARRFETDVSGLPTGPIFKSQASCVCVCHPIPVRMLNCQMRIKALPQVSTTQFKFSTNWFFYLRKALPTCPRVFWNLRPREFPKSDSSEMTTQRIALRHFKCRRTLAFNLVQERQLCS